ncbi:MAG TPA: zinc-binding dehydrogenase [Bryobacteraceae bacterium]|nr:zinc-binding dehydrogenase [Bryobacteraceae bacterium]
MTFAEAVSFPVTYATAYHALFRTACVRAGDWVLIHAAGGGVGIAAVQLCSTVEGVSVIGTASARKHSLLLQLGCAHAIDYHNQDYRAEVMRITKGRGVDVVLDPLGGSDNVQNYGLLAAEGRLVCYGFLNLVCGERRDVRHVSQQVRRLSSFNVRDLVATSRIVAGLNLTRINDRDARFRKATMQALFKLYEEGKIGPVIAEQYELENAPLGYSRMQRGESTGKIVVIM